MPGIAQPLPLPPPAESPVKRRRTKLWVGILGSIAIVTAPAVAVFLAGGDTGLPEQVGSFHRIRDSDTEMLEGMLERFTLADMEVEFAGYGEGSKIELFLTVYRNMPQQNTVLMAKGAAAGMVASGGEADPDAVTTVTRDGISYSCFAFDAPLLPGDVRFTAGYSCVWRQDDGVAVQLVSSRAHSREAAIADAALFAAALQD